MPINPDKFKKVVADHFANVTDEEFLENLRKSSPFDIKDGKILFQQNLTDRDPAE
jgi:hypothetical protein